MCYDVDQCGSTGGWVWGLREGGRGMGGFSPSDKGL